MKVVEGHPDLIKTIEDGEEVEDLSEDSDEEVEYQPSKQKIKRKADFNPKFEFVSSVEEFNKNPWDNLHKYIRRTVKRTLDERIERKRAEVKVEGSKDVDTDSDVNDGEEDVNEIEISDDELIRDEIKTKDKKLSKKQKLKQTTNNPTAAQMDAFLTFLEEHRELARGRLRNAEGRVRSRNLWAQLTDELNSQGGCIKNVKQWQKIWTDKKYLARKAAAAALSAAATGGGSSSAESISAQEQRIISVIGYGDLEMEAHVSTFPQNPPLQEQDQKIEVIPSFGPPSPASPVYNSPPQRHEYASAPARVYSAPRREYAASRHEHATPRHEHVAPRHASTAPQPVPKRRLKGLRRVSDEPNVRTRLFAIEEQRVATETQRAQELTLIRQAIQELCRVVQTGTQDILTELRTLRE